jgi:hypothetical protein
MLVYWKVSQIPDQYGLAVRKPNIGVLTKVAQFSQVEKRNWVSQKRGAVVVLARKPRSTVFGSVVRCSVLLLVIHHSKSKLSACISLIEVKFSSFSIMTTNIRVPSSFLWEVAFSLATSALCCHSSHYSNLGHTFLCVTLPDSGNHTLRLSATGYMMSNLSGWLLPAYRIRAIRCCHFQLVALPVPGTAYCCVCCRTSICDQRCWLDS